MRFCKDCAYFITSAEKCGRSYVAPDYVHGLPPRNSSAQIEREDRRPTACGPLARFFVAIKVAADEDSVNRYANKMIERDIIARHTGT